MNPYNPRLAKFLEKIYAELNHPAYIHPDPLKFLYEFDDPGERELVGLIAASLAFGRVDQILKSVADVLGRLGPLPGKALLSMNRGEFARIFEGFKYRYIGMPDLVDFFEGIRATLEKHGSLHACLMSHLRPHHRTLVEGAEGFVAELRNLGGIPRRNYLLPDPARGSACKRLNLFFRWMVRKDSVDPGGWPEKLRPMLIVPLDTHMHRLSKTLGLTSRNTADLRTAVEVTEGFRKICPEDPVKYDFALTRLGIRKGLGEAEVMNLLETVGTLAG